MTEYSPPMPALTGLDWDAGPSGDDVLVRRARAGDRAAFGALYDRFAPMVHGVLLARVPRADVDDLVHDVFMLAMRRLEGLRDPAAFGPWLAAIARNRSRDHYRRQRETDALTTDVAGPTPQHAEALAVLDAIRALPEAYRETLVLRLVEGMTGPEIAARTGLTHGSVRVNLHRGMHLLRDALEGRSRP